MIKKYILTSLLFIFLLTVPHSLIAQEVKKDSSETSFRKGRWFTGLSGAISSGTNENTTTGNKSNSNRYSIDISSGKFIKDRLLIGFLFSAIRNDIESDFTKTTESLFFGPKASYYFSDSKTGSLFYNISPGFVIYRDEASLILNDTFAELISEGSGFGILTTLGYSYVLHDRITFDLGLNVSASWITVDQKSEIIEVEKDVNFTISNLSFSFGFNVLLDEFFF